MNYWLFALRANVSDEELIIRHIQKIAFLFLISKKRG